VELLGIRQSPEEKPIVNIAEEHYQISIILKHTRKLVKLKMMAWG
jgi:hypothetical protein